MSVKYSKHKRFRQEKNKLSKRELLLVKQYAPILLSSAEIIVQAFKAAGIIAMRHYKTWLKEAEKADMAFAQYKEANS
jgi:hypothetical protein